MIEARYSDFLSSGTKPSATLAIELAETNPADAEAELQVTLEAGSWNFRRGDFFAHWDPVSGIGRVRQAENPYAIDSVLRILHSLILAPKGGLLVHAASAVRDGRSYLFCGVSGAGKTTISRLAPADVILLTDEISYVVQTGSGFAACGTPFSGELATPGKNCSAPLDTIFLLEKGSTNRIESLSSKDAIHALMRNILFFAHDQRMVEQIFGSACRLIESVPVRRLIFTPNPRVWEIIETTAGVAV